MNHQLNAIYREHPVPWSYGSQPNGLVLVFDAAGKQVQLFTMLDLVVAVTAEHARAAAPAPAPV